MEKLVLIVNWIIFISVLGCGRNQNGEQARGDYHDKNKTSNNVDVYAKSKTKLEIKANGINHDNEIKGKSAGIEEDYMGQLAKTLQSQDENEIARALARMATPQFRNKYPTKKKTNNNENTFASFLDEVRKKVGDINYETFLIKIINNNTLCGSKDGKGNVREQDDYARQIIMALGSIEPKQDETYKLLEMVAEGKRIGGDEFAFTTLSNIGNKRCAEIIQRILFSDEAKKIINPNYPEYWHDKFRGYIQVLANNRTKPEIFGVMFKEWRENKDETVRALIVRALTADKSYPADIENSEVVAFPQYNSAKNESLEKIVEILKEEEKRLKQEKDSDDLLEQIRKISEKVKQKRSVQALPMQKPSAEHKNDLLPAQKPSADQKPDISP